YFLSTAKVDEFVAKRRADRGRRPGSIISAHTVNRDLRHVKAALAVAKEWGYLDAVPKVRMVKAVKRLPRYVTGEPFRARTAARAACDRARSPQHQPFPPGDFWRALVTMGYLTGWRIGDMIGLKRCDLDFDSGTALSRGDVNKGKRDELVKLHPVVIEHLRK